MPTETPVEIRPLFSPEVYLAGRQTVDDRELNRFLVDHGVPGWRTDTEVGAEVVTETAGRLCYMSFAKPRPGGNHAYLEHIKTIGHGSVLEHGVWNLIVTGISRSLSHEFVRHRAGFGYSQLSQRYVDESVGEYVVPPLIQRFRAVAHKLAEWRNPPEDDTENRSQLIYSELRAEHGSISAAEEKAAIWHRWWDAVRAIHGEYVWLIGALSKHTPREVVPAADGSDNPSATDVKKFVRSTARSVLPNATETKIFVTANARALRHFLEQRCHPAAEAEIRVLAGKMWEVLVRESPTLFGDYTRVPQPDGTYALTTQYKKV